MAGPADILQTCGLSAGALLPGPNLPVVSTQLVAELRQPCDVASLWIMDRQGGNWLQASKRMTSEPVGPRVPLRVAGDLKQFDLVFERAVDYVGRAIGEGTTQTMDKAKKKLVFQGTGKYVGTCAHKLHPRLQMTPVGQVECEPKQEKVAASKIEPMEIVARRAAYSGEWNGFKWNGFSSLWIFDSGSTQVWVVKAASCGIPIAPPALRELTALVRAHPRDAYEFSFNMPAAFSYSGERSGSVYFDPWAKNASLKGRFGNEHKKSETVKEGGETTLASETSDKRNLGRGTEKNRSDSKYSDGALLTKETSEKADKDGKVTELKEKNTTQLSEQSKGNVVAMRVEGSKEETVSAKDGYKLDEKLELKREIKPAVSLKKNGRVINATTFLNSVLDLKKTFLEAFASIKKIVPSVGWKISTELKILEGSVTIKWGVENPEDVDLGDDKPIYDYTGSRYVAVRDYWSVDIKCVTIGASLTLMVGVEVEVNVIFWDVGELVIKLEGKLSGEEALEWKCTSDVPVAAPTLQYVFEGAVSGVCKANMVGQHLIDASASLTGGFQVTATPHVSFEHAPSVEGKLERLDTEVVYWGACGKEKPDPVKVTLFDKKKIWEGDLLGKTEKSGASGT